MVIFAKIRQAFTAVVGEVTHEAGVIVAVTEDEFKAIAHKVEVLGEDVAQELHLTRGHALAVSPAVTAATGAVLNRTATPAPEALVPSTDPAVPAGSAAPAPAAAQEAAEPVAAASDGAQDEADAGTDSAGGAAA